jgi:hypothetical protein
MAGSYGAEFLVRFDSLLNVVRWYLRIGIGRTNMAYKCSRVGCSCQLQMFRRRSLRRSATRTRADSVVRGRKAQKRSSNVHVISEEERR